MLLAATSLLVAAAYGLACGNPAHRVLVAGYEFAVIPVYFFAATLTLPTAQALRGAAGCYLAGAAGLAAVELTAPDRHGGLLSALALPPLLVVAARERGWRRAGTVLLVAVAGTDVVLAAYRAVWLATAVALLLLAVRDLAVAFAALTCGFLVAAAFAGPTDGHWELGLLPAVTLLITGSRAAAGNTPRTDRP